MGTIVMSQKECKRLKVIEAFVRGYITREEAAVELALSKRQITRIRKRYEEFSNTGILRKKRDSKPPRSYDEAFIKKVLELVKDFYADFGPTLAAEKLQERHNIVIAKETLRRWMIKAGLHKAHQRPVKKIHPLRKRRSCLGELIQIDGSHHAWFEGRAPVCCLLVFIDDATGQLLHLQFTPSESHESYAQAFSEYLHKHGKPRAIYTDKHSVFSVNRKEISVNADGITAFRKSLHELGIEPILAHSPQAKGRVERVNKTLQQRLIKEMRLREISSLEEGNAFLEEFMQSFNARFSVVPEKSDNKHQPLSLNEQERLPLIFSTKEARTVSPNLTVQFENQYYQLDLKNKGRRIQHDGVLVCKMPNNEIIITDTEGRILPYTVISKPIKAPKICGSKDLNSQVEAVQTKPAPDHPWRKAHSSIHQQHFRAYAQKLARRRAI